MHMALPLAYGGTSRVLGLKILRVQRKGGEFSPVQSPLPSRGSSGDYALCPFHLHDFYNVILAFKMEVLRA
jgi:hypothetical protein